MQMRHQLQGKPHSTEWLINISYLRDLFLPKNHSLYSLQNCIERDRRTRQAKEQVND